MHPNEEEKVDPAVARAAETHAHFAGRQPCGSQLPICVSKNGVNHVSLGSGTIGFVASFVLYEYANNCIL